MMGGKDVKITGQGLAQRQPHNHPASFCLTVPALPTQRGNESGQYNQNSALTLPSAELSFYP